MSEYINPYSSSKRWLRGNLHGHTCCGRFMDVTESGPMFASLGYDFMAVTDHNKAPDEKQWRFWQEQAGLVLIPGEENGRSDHILEVGVHQVNETSEDGYVERAEALRAAGGFTVGCHPQEYVHGGENIRAAANVLHAFEIFNGLREGRGCNEVANIELWDDILTKGGRIWGVATDDFHCQYTSPGHGWVMVQVAEEADITWPLIVEKLKAGAFFSSTYPAFEQILLEGNELRVFASVPTQRIRVLGPEGRTLHLVEDSELNWQTQAGLTYFRVQAECGIKRAWSQPFFPAQRAG